MKTRFFNPRILKALLIGALAIFGVSCSKTTETIGNGLLPEGDYIGAFYTDTIEITCHSVIVDTMATKGMTTVLLGSRMDPVMGRTDANIFTQLHLSSANQRFGSSPIVDSIVLQFGISGYYGDTTTMQTVHVYELADSLTSSSEYYQFSDVATLGTDLANSYQFHPHPKTALTVTATDTIYQATIRIPLSNSFGEQLVAADSTVYDSPEAFKDFCYGLKICCESVTQDGSICYLYPTTNDITRLTLYYRETPSSNQMRYYFYITSEDTYFNQYLHDYNQGSAEFVQQVVQGDTTMGQQQLYLQSMGGIRSMIKFPNIGKWQSILEDHTHLIINDAKLIFPAYLVDVDSSAYTAPASLALLNIKEDGNTSLVQDYYEGSTYYGGTYSYTNKNVTFRIAEHLQDILLGRVSCQGLYVSITGASYNAQRWIIAGPEANQEQKLRCEIKYSIIGE